MDFEDPAFGFMGADWKQLKAFTESCILPYPEKGQGST